jgi:hypothetical protein
MNNWLHMAGSKFSEEVSEWSRNNVNQENSTLGLEVVEAEENAEKREDG